MQNCRWKRINFGVATLTSLHHINPIIDYLPITAHHKISVSYTDYIFCAFTCIYLQSVAT